MSEKTAYGYTWAGCKDSEGASEVVARHHWDTALKLASMGIRLARTYETTETVSDGVTYVGWRAEGWVDALLNGATPVGAEAAEVALSRLREAVEGEASALDKLADEMPTEEVGLRLGARSLRSALARVAP